MNLIHPRGRVKQATYSIKAESTVERFASTRNLLLNGLS